MHTYHTYHTYPDDVICTSYVLSDRKFRRQISKKIAPSMNRDDSMQVENLVTDVNNMRADFQGAAETAFLESAWSTTDLGSA